jgi:acetyltransferase-like isoleucine patch superfamily enzyme
MKTIAFVLIFISPPFIKNYLLRWLCSAKIGKHVHVGWFSAVAGEKIEIGDYSTIRPLTIIKLDGKLQIGNYSEISSFTLIYGSSDLILGDQCYIGPQCLINVDEVVIINNESALGARCMVFTHGSFYPYTEGYWVKLNGVNLGSRVWCAAGVFIHPGVEIGNNTFVNSGSVVTQSLPADSIVEGNPAQVVYPMDRVKREMTPKRVDLALEKILHEFAEIGLRRELKITAKQKSRRELQLDWKGKTYKVMIVPSTIDGGDMFNFDQKARYIFLVNQPNWTAPEGSLSFDIPHHSTRYNSDPIHSAFRRFALRYYGLKFKDG